MGDRGVCALRRRVEAGVLWIVLVSGLVVGSNHTGVSWDEVTYFDFSDHVRAWWRAGAPLDAAALQQAWAYDRYLNPHPPLMRALSAWTAAQSGLPFPTNYRLATLMLCSAMLAGMYALLRDTLGVGGALLAVLAVVLQPRVYGDLLNATTDAPVALAFCVLCLLGWRTLQVEREARAPLRALMYAAYGVATAIKFTGFLAIAPVGLYFLWRRQWREVCWSAGAVVWALGFLIATSPDRWHEPLTGVLAFISYPFTRSAIPISTYYFGKSYPFYLPWHYFDVMTALTLPLPVLLALPFACIVPAPYRSLRNALLWPIGFWCVLAHLPSTPRHDGVRQFLAVMPLLGVLCVLGYLAVAARVAALVPPERSRSWSRASLTAAGLSLVLAFAPWVHLPLSSYNALIGGLPGATAAGLQTTYYLEVISPRFVARMNAVLEPGDSVMLLPSWPGLLRRYQAEGLLRRDIQVVDDLREHPRYLLLVRRRGVMNDELFFLFPAVIETGQDDVVLARLSPIER